MPEFSFIRDSSLTVNWLDLCKNINMQRKNAQVQWAYMLIDIEDYSVIVTLNFDQIKVYVQEHQVLKNYKNVEWWLGTNWSKESWSTIGFIVPVLIMVLNRTDQIGDPI